jgi:hypothetical protein
MRLRRLIARLRELVTDPASSEPTAEPLTQILMNSHSPVVLAALKAGRELPIDVVFADVIATADPHAGSITRKTRLRPIRADLLMTVDEAHVTPAEVARYLETVDTSA